MTPEAAFHDHWMTAKGPALRELSEHLHGQLERSSPSRRRDAGQRKRQIVENLTANLAHLLLSPEHTPGRRLAIPTAKKAASRYDRADYPQNLCAGTLDVLNAEGIIIKHPYQYKRQHTTIEPTGFILSLQQHGVSLSDIGRYQGAEAIWLTARTGEAGFGGEAAPKTLVHYQDTADSNRYRQAVLKFNAHLNRQEITFGGILQAPTSLRRMFLLRSPIDPTGFNLNGRL